MVKTSRRQFLQTLSRSGALCVLLQAFAQASSSPGVRLHAEVKPLARILEDTPRERLLEEVGLRVWQGLGYRRLLAASSSPGCATSNRFAFVTA